ncbi:MAG: phage holin family protein [bacterium]
MNAYLVAFAFVTLDYITGLCKAWATESFSSAVMRAGLWHKLALLFAMAAGWLADYAQRVVDIGIAAPVGGAICVYIITMELVSSIENIGRMNPELLPDRVLALFGQKKP